jgi:NAD(P)H-flavin reductase
MLPNSVQSSLMYPPQQCVTKLSDRQVFNDKFILLTFGYTQPAQVPFQAGQYVSVLVSDHGDRRSYSIASSPEVTHSFDLLADISPAGVGSTFLANAPIGSEVKVLGPLGRFIISEGTDESELVFLATGSGIAPIKSMILDQLQVKGDKRPMTLYWGMRHVEQLFWVEEFTQLAEAFPHFSFHPVISQPMPEWTLCRGRVTDCLRTHQPHTEKAGYYICGNAPMLQEVMQILTERGVPVDRQHHEKFH